MRETDPPGPFFLIPLLVGVAVLLLGLFLMVKQILTEPSTVSLYVWIRVVAPAALLFVGRVAATQPGKPNPSPRSLKGRINAALSSKENSRIYDAASGIGLTLIAIGGVFRSYDLGMTGLCVVSIGLMVQFLIAVVRGPKSEPSDRF